MNAPTAHLRQGARRAAEVLAFLLAGSTGAPFPTPWPQDVPEPQTPPGTAAQPPDAMAGHPRRGAGHSET